LTNGLEGMMSIVERIDAWLIHKSPERAVDLS
jgi:hypothetical protein